MQTIQRARGAESRVRYRSANGPLRVQSNAIFRRVFCNVWHALIVGVFSYLKVHDRFFMNQGGTADKFDLFVLDSGFC